MEYPVKKGQRLELQILRGGDGGCGVASVEGLTVLVEQALPGERVLAEIAEVRPKFARAQVLRVQAPSPVRTPPRCPLYGTCGGCRMQFMDYSAHLSALEAQVSGLLSRVGGARDFALLPIAGMDDPWRYRNKAVFRVGGTAQDPRLGFVGRGTHDLVPATDCLLQSEAACAAARAVQDWMCAHRIPPYDERTRRGVLRYLMVRTNRRGEALATLVTTSAELPQKEALLEALQAALPNLRGAVQNVN
ncbi:MAG: class I SAM-dependent RNA methyltransferase, partial [Candidatus Spyradocola sp.]